MSYKYVNGCFEVTTDIRNGFKRFHSMNAQHAMFTIDDDKIPRWIVYQFVSYATNVIQVVKDMKYETFVVSCNGNPFGYSRSTSRQITRWINERWFFPFTSDDIRFAYNECIPITPDISTFNYDNVTIDFHSSTTFHNVWR